MDKPSRVGCVWIPGFPIAVARRDSPEYRGVPIVLVGGESASERDRVRSVSDEARAAGVFEGQTVVQAEAVCPGLAVVRWESAAGIRPALESLERVLRQIAPSVETEGEGLFFLDVRGLGLLHGGGRDAALEGEGDGEKAIVRAMREAVEIEEFEGRYGIAGTRFAAFAAALAPGEEVARGDGVIVPPGGESAFLARLPLTVLPMSADLAERLRGLGLRTAGEYAALPPTSVERRYGEEGVRLHRLARGLDDPFVPAPPPADEPSVARELEPPADDLMGLLPAVEAAASPLFDALAARDEGAFEILLVLDFEGGGVRPVRVRVARATARWTTFERLLRPALTKEALPDRVCGFRLLVIERARRLAETGGLFARSSGRPGRDRDRVSIAIGEIGRLCGPGAALRPAVCDRHRPEARRRFEAFRPGRMTSEEGPEPIAAVSALPPVWRWVDPPEELRVTMESDRLKGIYHRGRLRAVAACRGPERISGEWWERAFARDYYDVETAGGGAYRVFRDLANGRWYLQGVID